MSTKEILKPFLVYIISFGSSLFSFFFLKRDKLGIVLGNNNGLETALLIILALSSILIIRRYRKFNLKPFWYVIGIIGLAYSVSNLLTDYVIKNSSFPF